MSCTCVRQALYAAKCANIPADIFSTITCSKHSNPKGADKSTDQNRVTLVICPDSAVIESENVASWPVVYHGTAVELIHSVLKHCMILKAGDVLFDGNKILRRNTVADSVGAVWTYPQPEGAKTAASVGVYDGGETQFQMIIQLRQKQGTYTVHPKGGYGLDVWSTERRGTLIIEALEVHVSKSKGAIKPSPMRPLKSTFVTSFQCPVQQRAFNAMKLLKLPTEIFDMTHNRCYCESCYPKTWPDLLDYAGENYVIPRGWVRFGLLVNPVFAKMNCMWESWHSAYHGCHPRNVISIFRTRMLLIPHDVFPDGRKLAVCSSADRNQQFYFLSPEI